MTFLLVFSPLLTHVRITGDTTSTTATLTLGPILAGSIDSAANQNSVTADNHTISMDPRQDRIGLLGDYSQPNSGRNLTNRAGTAGGFSPGFDHDTVGTGAAMPAVANQSHTSDSFRNDNLNQSHGIHST